MSKVPGREGTRCSVDSLRSALEPLADQEALHAAQTFVASYLQTAGIWPLDHQDHRRNLAVAGLREDGHRYGVGVRVTAFLLGTGWAPIVCSPGGRCVLYRCPVTEARRDVLHIEIGRASAGEAWVHQHLDARSRSIT